jgi:hypothetical protein
LGSTVIAAGKGEYGDAALSILGVIPWLGDSAKLAKIKGWVAKVLRAIRFASKNPHFRSNIAPLLSGIRDLIDRVYGVLPKSVQEQLDKLRKAIDDFLDPKLADKGKGCFPADTLIDTDRGLRPIQTVRRSDRVWAYDLAASEWTLRQVLETYEHDYDGDVVRITTGNEELAATGNHPLWVVRGDGIATRPAANDVHVDEQGNRYGGRWIEARHVKVGDWLLTRSGAPVRVTGLHAQNESVGVYNLRIEELNNYAVGSVGLLVHNKAFRRHRPKTKPKDAPHGTLAVDVDPRTKGRVHEIKGPLLKDGVGPDSYLGVTPDGRLIATNVDGTYEVVGHLN